MIYLGVYLKYYDFLKVYVEIYVKYLQQSFAVPCLPII